VVIFFDPLWHSLNASVLPTLEPAMENEERREHYRQLNQNQQDRNQRKGHRNHSLPRWATSSHHSLRAIHKRIIALIAVRRSPKWGIYGVAWCYSQAANFRELRQHEVRAKDLLSADHPTPPGPTCALLSAWGIGVELIAHRAPPSFNRLPRLASSSAASSAAPMPKSVRRYSPCAVRLELG
jgi:hypothetical protein